MPKRPNTPCKHPGCPKLVPYGSSYCEEHKSLHYDESRNSDRRGYTNKWRKISKSFLKTHPLCVRCKAEGRYTKATVVDHIIPHRGDPKIFWDMTNWQPLCKHHHDVKTMTEDHDINYTY